MAKDKKNRIGIGLMKPATQSAKKGKARSAQPGHHSKVVGRINRGHGKGFGQHPNMVPFEPH